MTTLADKTAVITGASAGLGRAIAESFARAGCSLIITARNAERLNAAVVQLQQSGANVVGVAGDAADENHAAEVFARAGAKVDVLVNNAGAFDGGPLGELSTDDWNRVLATNLTAPFLFTSAAMRAMKQTGGGRIINIGSISARRVRPNSAAYSASKHGLWGLTQVTALEGREHGITCCCINPGNIFVERRETENAEDQEPMMTAEEVAQVVLSVAALPSHVQVLETVVLPHQQEYVGRG